MTLILISAAVIASVLLTGGVYPAQWNWSLIVIGIAALTARIKNSELDRFSTLLLGIIGGIAVLQIWTVSTVPYETAQQVLTLAGYAVILLLIRSIALTGPSPWMPVWPLLAIAAIESPIGILQSPIAHGTYVSRDHYAGLLEMILPFAVMYSIAALRRREVIKGWALLTLASLIVAAILHTYSRTGYLVSMVGLLICGCMSFSRRWRIPAIAAAVVLTLIYLPDAPLVARFSTVLSDVRFQIWPEALELAKSYPVFGCGLGGFESCFMRFQTVLPMYTVDYAHNDYLQILAEIGPIALFAGLVFAARLLRATIRRAKNAPSVDQRFLAVASTASLVAMLIHSFVDFNLYIPANGAIFAWICGLAATGLDSRRVEFRSSVQPAKFRTPRRWLQPLRALWRP